MGTPEFSVPALRALLSSHHNVIAVYTQPPRPKGRGQQEQKSPVHLAADESDVAVFHPLSFKKDPDAVAQFAALNADVAVVAAYGLILPVAVLDAPRFGCLNIHASLLPRWRGASPIQRAVWAGDDESGITIMQMEAGLDTGPMIEKRRLPITAAMTAQDLHDGLSAMGGDMIVGMMDRLAAAQSRLPATVQDDTQSNYAPMLSRDDGRVNWTLDAIAIDRQVRGLTPWPGVWCLTAQGQRLKILQAALATIDHSNAAAGTILDRHGHVACGTGQAIMLRRVQPENAKPMDFASALNGGYLNIGDVLV